MARLKYIATLGSILLVSSSLSPAMASAAERYTFDIPPQELKFALRSVTRKSGLQLFANSDDLRDRASGAVHATLSPQEALDQLLAGTGLEAQIEGKAVFIRGRGPSAAASSSAAATADEIVVTGTHLRGAALASPVITLSQQDMRDAGQNSLPEALRDLPQNFSGGQNPGVGLGISGSNNRSGGSTIDLRGIGGDATLTLLNGHRLSYGVSLQSVDISSIPFLAIDRVEVVPDGSSALYGSDAVAGVANIILKRDYDGVLTDLRIGGATDGGDSQQQYSILAGTRWSGGGIAASYEFSRDTAIEAEDRSYARAASAGTTLQPFLKHHDGALSLHQDLAPGLVFSLDMIGNARWNVYHYAVDGQGNYLLNGGRISTQTTSLAVSPSLTWSVAGDWSLSLTGMYGLDRTHYRGDSFYANSDIYTTAFCNCNSAQSIEASANGSLFDIPGGPIKLAVGAGYRTNHFTQTDLDIRATDKVGYVYGEAEIPIVSASNARSLIRKLSLSGAVRYEDYRHGSSVATPKFGVVYAPVEGLVLRGSWGKSFKAPTLFQRYNAVRVGYYPASYVGGGATSTATALDLIGGNPNLKAERATSWSAGFAWTPASIPDLSIDASYFDIRYRDRVVTPITYETLALSDPQYANLVNFAPTAAEIAETLASGPFDNIVGQPFDASSVIAIIDNRFVNAGRQMIHGVDIASSYKLTLGHSTFRVTGSASYLHSRQQLSAGQPVQHLAGTLYNPPHFRARAGVVWSREAITLSGFANYIGSLRDERFDPSVGIRSMTTIDLNARYRVLFGHIVNGLEVSLSVSNLLDRKPSLIRGTPVYEQPYDPTNFSPVGRLVSIGIQKRW